MNRIIVLQVLVLLLVACSTTEPTPDAEVVVAEATEVIAESTSDASIPVDSPEGRGQVLFFENNETGFACASCHYVSERRLIGPGLANIEERAADYNPYDDIQEYIRMSIVAPADILTPHEPAYPQNVMPQIYGDVYSADEIDDLIAYILSL